MLRCVNIVPGGRARRVDSGTRESEQPIQRRGGDWPFERVRWSVVVEEAQCALEVRADWKWSVFSQNGISVSLGV